jgi:hypothetical protein
MRSISEQTEEELGGPWSVLVRQKRDHVRLDELLHELEAAPRRRQPGVLQRIYRLVFPHAFAEEAVLWPALRKALPDGDRLTLAVEEEHQQINELVAELDETSWDDPARDALLTRIVDWLRQDVRDEEDVLLPRLQEALSVKELRRLGVAWEALRRTSPTRAHPVVSRRPPGQTLSALPLTVLDRSRDVLDAGARRSERLRPVLESVSRVLGRGARRTEHLGVFRTGERPETHRP